MTVRIVEAETFAAPHVAYLKIDSRAKRRCLVKVPMTIQELIDLEGACAALRLQLEVGDQPKETVQPERPNPTPTGPMTRQRFFDKFGIDFEGEVAALVREHAPVQSVNGQGGHVLIANSQPTLMFTATNTANSAPAPTDGVQPAEIGSLVDWITQNSRRSPVKVARRVLEECVEMCLAAGTTPQEILTGVSDSLHNQALKASATDNVTVFPSQIKAIFSRRELTKEMADVQLVLADLMYVSGISPSSVHASSREKFERLSDPSAQFATDGHTFYLRKPHVKDGTPRT